MEIVGVLSITLEISLKMFQLVLVSFREQCAKIITIDYNIVYFINKYQSQSLSSCIKNVSFTFILLKKDVRKEKLFILVCFRYKKKNVRAHLSE